MPYALFCNDARLSKAYPTEADVWKEARKSGLVIDIASEEETPAPRPVLENDYEIRPCPRTEAMSRRARSGSPARSARPQRPRQARMPAAAGGLEQDELSSNRHPMLFWDHALRRGRRQRRLRGREHHARFLTVQAADRAGDLEHLADRT